MTAFDVIKIGYYDGGGFRFFVVFRDWKVRGNSPS